MTEEFVVEFIIDDVSPEELYRGWLDSKTHSDFTDSKASIDPNVGGPFTAWDGYISGTTIELEENKRIVQNWRTTEFPETAEDSLLELLFEKTETGAILILKHSNIPDGQGEDYKAGWKEFYFNQMAEYYN